MNFLTDFLLLPIHVLVNGAIQNCGKDNGSSFTIKVIANGAEAAAAAWSDIKGKQLYFNLVKNDRISLASGIHVAKAAQGC
jgi:hypothetical protein